MRWWFWGAVVIVMNILGYRQRQAPEYPLLPPSRWFFGFVALMMLVLTFTISPFQCELTRYISQRASTSTITWVRGIFCCAA